MVVEKAYAKINLCLDVVGKRDDGYHELKMIMVPIELHDKLTFTNAIENKVDSNIVIEDNAILKTIKYMQNKYNVHQNVHVKLDKNIPIGAGLGGGSADISATLRGLNQLWALNLSLKDLEEDANALGSDTLFCLYNKTAYVYGRGDKIEFLEAPDFDEIYLLNPGIEVSTKEVFKQYNPEFKSHQFDDIFEHFIHKNYEKFFKSTYNDLHKTAILTYKNLEKYEKTIKKVYKNAYMSGSGSTYFFINFDKNNREISEKLDKTKLNYIKTAPKK